MEMSDSLTNLATGLGVMGRDKTSAGAFTPRPMFKQELDAAYENDWLAGSIVDIPADDMTRKWRAWSGSPTQVKALTSSEKRLQVRASVNKSMKMARLYGGGALLIGDGSSDPRQPLWPESISRGGIKYVHALSRYEIFAGPPDRDPASPWFGEPTQYTIGATQSAGRGVSSGAIIHPSRVVRLLGHERAETISSVDSWGFSVIQRAYDAVRNVAAASGNLSVMTYEGKVDVVSVPNLAEKVGDPSYRERMQQRFRLANMMKSTLGMLILDAAETYTQKELNLSGMPDALRLFLEIACGAADIPATRLMGSSPKGMNATGESDLRNYYDMLSAQQETKIGPRLDRLDDLLIRDALGSRPKAVDYKWNSLWQVRENEQSAINLQKAQVAEIYGCLGIMSKKAMAKAIQAMLLEANGPFPGLQEILDEFGGDPEPLSTKQQAAGGLVVAPPGKNAPPPVNA